MRKIGTAIGIAAFSAAGFNSAPSEAFGVRLGPFYIGLPFHRHHHRPHLAALHDDSGDRTVDRTPPPAQIGPTSPLLSPAYALPVVLDGFFSPSASTPWPLSYDAILQGAFAKAGAGRGEAACPQPDRGSAIGERIRREVRPAGNQTELAQKLDGAIVMASAYLAKACPSDVPADPAARLQLMEWQVEKLAEALDIVRQPLAEFEQSLNQTQRARFSAPSPSAPLRQDGAVNIAPACAVTPTKVDATIEQISLAVEPTDAQRDAMNTLKQSFNNAVNELDANCSAAPPADPLARLEATEARLDATWRALVSMQSALAGLEKQLSEPQRAHLEATDFASVE